MTKEPNPVCLPTTKTWEWYLGNAITDFEAFDDHFTVEANRGTLLMLDASDGAPGAIPVPHLLAIPNVLVNLLCTQGLAITPHNVLLTVDNFILSSLHPPGPQWDCVQKWCLVAGQSGANGRARFSWKPALSPSMTRTLITGWEIIWIYL